MNTDKIHSQRVEYENFEFNLENLYSHDELKHAIAKSLNILDSQVMVYSSNDTVDNFNGVVVKVRNYNAGFRTHVEIYNYLCPQNPLTYLRLLCIDLQARLLIESLDIVSSWILCTPDGHLSYINADESGDEDDYLTLSVATPSRPFCRVLVDQLQPETESIDSQSDQLIHEFSSYLEEDFTEVNAEFRVSNMAGHQGQLCQLIIFGVDNLGVSAFLDVKDISQIAFLLECISVLSGGLESIAKNVKFRITMNSLEMEQESPGRSYRHFRKT